MASAPGDVIDVELNEGKGREVETLKISIESLSRIVPRIVQGELVYELAFLTFPPRVQTKIIMFMVENIIKFPRDTMTAFVDAVKEKLNMLEPWPRVTFMRLDYSRALLESSKDPASFVDFPLMSPGKTRKVEPFFVSDHARTTILGMLTDAGSDGSVKPCAADTGAHVTGVGQKMDIDFGSEDLMQLPDPDMSALAELESLPDSPPIVSSISDETPQEQTLRSSRVTNPDVVKENTEYVRMDIDIQPLQRPTEPERGRVFIEKIQSEIINLRFENLPEVLDTLLTDGSKGEIEFACQETVFARVPANHMASILCILEKHITPLGYVTSKNILHSIVFTFITIQSTPLPRSFVGNFLAMLKAHSKVVLRSVVIPLLLLDDFSQVTEDLISKTSREKILDQDAITLLVGDFFDSWIEKCKERPLLESVISTLQRFFDDATVVLSPELATKFLSFVETTSSRLEKSLKFGKFLYTVISNNREVFSPVKNRLTVQIKKNTTFMAKKALKCLEQV